MNFASFDLNMLKVLDALLRERSTTRAGERVGLSQPAVSAALGRLRHALDDPLFVRRGQGLEPTDYARAIAIPLREALDGIEALLTGPKHFDPAVANEIFRLSGTDFFAEMLMPDLAERVSRQAPDMRVQLLDLVPNDYVATLERYEVDIALMPRMAFPDWVETRDVFRSSFVVIARKDHPALTGLPGGASMPLDLFCDLGHVLMSPEGKLSAMGDAALAEVGRQRNVVMTLPFFSGVLRAVAASDLISLVPQQLARRMARLLGLRIFAPPMTIAPAQIVMAWHRRSSANPAHRWLRGEIADLLGALDETPGTTAGT